MAPNILVLFPEDMRADCISAYGNPHIRTPHLDGLVSSGFNFRQNYCAGADSGAVCIPSRAMLMSGKHWLHSNHELHGETIFPQLLRENGYTTFITGKWHNGGESALRGFERARSLFLGGMSDHTRVPVQDIADGAFENQGVGERFSSELFADAPSTTEPLGAGATRSSEPGPGRRRWCATSSPNIMAWSPTSTSRSAASSRP